MAYETKPGNGSLFKNAKKEKETHPDYTGTAVLPDGSEVWLSMWLKKSDKGTNYMSLSMKTKEAKSEAADKAVEVPAPTEFDPFDNDAIPF
ncbi:DUF736 domain-containing protein [Mesorhizobium sp. M8A.F.Ca.ET.165.01.1.1]|uniref:DUF736 domain-containing protein n=1 Tax=Mesorhizobium sp. M8A.F.Ca.ET.165.01.1.1 TaxID=2563960 RepID=UPI0010940A42|nr:DUF736 domain-containing protein [Mesorhizobium sp. M8A.F.Ca.ET.165.01.1.1]TGT42764.1 DUF736 domain-containing protein [Mesorhizobium sp. M8A.F.Ca.ET.165.01.1.1]